MCSYVWYHSQLFFYNYVPGGIHFVKLFFFNFFKLQKITWTRSISAVDGVIEAADFEVDVEEVVRLAVEVLNIEATEAVRTHEVGGAVVGVGEDTDVLTFEDFWASNRVEGGGQD